MAWGHRVLQACRSDCTRALFTYAYLQRQDFEMAAWVGVGALHEFGHSFLWTQVRELVQIAGGACRGARLGWR